MQKRSDNANLIMQKGNDNIFKEFLSGAVSDICLRGRVALCFVLIQKLVIDKIFEFD